MEYTIKLIDEYRVCGIDGIHLYALNKYDDVASIVKAGWSDRPRLIQASAAPAGVCPPGHSSV